MREGTNKKIIISGSEEAVAKATEAVNDVLAYPYAYEMDASPDEHPPIKPKRPTTTTSTPNNTSASSGSFGSGSHSRVPQTTSLEEFPGLSSSSVANKSPAPTYAQFVRGGGLNDNDRVVNSNQFLPSYLRSSMEKVGLYEGGFYFFLNVK